MTKKNKRNRNVRPQYLVPFDLTLPVFHSSPGLRFEVETQL